MNRLVEEAESSLTAGHHQQAVSKYLQAAAEYPSCRSKIKEQLLISLSHVIDAISLAIAIRPESCHRDAATSIIYKSEGSSCDELTSDQLLFSQISESMCSMFADDADAMTMLGVKCLDEGVYHQAEFFLRVALEADGNCLSAKENLRVLFDRMVNRWHFHMLNDVQRNSTYFRAIHNVMKSIPNCSVLDIGSGTGILSMMAKRSGAKNVYACEMNDAMVSLSYDALAANGLADSVTIVHSLSTMLTVPKNLPDRVNLVVTEIVDAGLLGEHIIPTLRHAWKELLLPCKGRGKDQTSNQMTSTGHVIPCGAVVHAMAIDCPDIRRRSRLVVSDVGGIMIEPIVLEGSCRAPESNSALTFWPSVSYKKTSSHKGLSREPYTCERLTQIRGGYRRLSAAIPVLQFDFTNPEIPLPESHIPLAAVNTGQLDAIAVWFDLHLDSQNSFSTGPSWDISWEQAIFPVRETICLQPGDIVQLHASCTDTLLHMKVGEVSRRGTGAVKAKKLQCSHSPSSEGGGGGETSSVVVNSQQDVDLSRQSDEAAELMKLNGKMAKAEIFQDKGPPLFYVERSELCRLNDSGYIECYRRAMAEAVEAVKNGELEESESEVESSSSEMEEEEQPANCLVLDLAHGLSPFGLMAAKEGADFVQIGRTHEMYKSLVELLAESNKISGHVSFRYLNLPGMSHSQVVWDIVVCDIINPQGELRAGVLEELAYIRSTSFHSSSFIIPSHITVHAALISSPSLRANCSVLGTVPTLGFDIAQFINKYQVTHYTDLNLSTCPHLLLSESHEMIKVDLNSLSKKPLKIERRVTMEVKSEGTAVGVAYWFTLHLYGDITIATYQPMETGSHWHQSVFLFPEDVTVSRGQSVTLRTLLRDSYLDITMVTANPTII